jgi:hypothetical protein
MHLQFEFTHDDIIGAAQRCLARSKTVRDGAFGSPEERRRFIELTQSYIELAGVGRAVAASQEGRDQLRGLNI